MDGSVVVHLPDYLVREGHDDDGRIFMEFVCRSLRTDEIHIGDVQVRDEHEKDEVIRYIFLVSCSMPIPWPSHLPSFSSLDDLFGRHKTTDFSYIINDNDLVFVLDASSSSSFFIIYLFIYFFVSLLYFSNKSIVQKIN